MESSVVFFTVTLIACNIHSAEFRYVCCGGATFETDAIVSYKSLTLFQEFLSKGAAFQQ